MLHANVKLLSVLAIILLTSSYVSIAAANPLPLATPTPTPTPTSTATPTPTPKPEPKIYPTLEMYCSSTVAANNLKVQVTGTLTYNKTGIPNTPIYIAYSANSGNRWENFSLVNTNADGGFGATWIPNATGNYLICSQWKGNDTLHWINATANLALTPDAAGNLFSVVSNSTITNLSYDVATQKLSFTTNGTSRTTGYAYISLPKALASDVKTLQVDLDGQSIVYNSESQDDAWVISCVYAQSAHVFTIQMPPAQVLGTETTPWVPIVIAIAVLIAVLAVALTLRRRRRTNATVAAILKQNRPLY